MKNKLVLYIIAMLLTVILVLGAALMLWNYYDKKSANAADPTAAANSAAANVKVKKLTSTQIKDLTVEMKDILTNLADKDKVVKVSLAFQLENSKAKSEFTNLDFKVKNVIIQTLSDMTADQISGSKGQEMLKSTLINRINQSVLTEGKLTAISITDIIVQ